MKNKKGQGGPFEALRTMKAELKKKEAESSKPPPAPQRPAPKARHTEEEALSFHRLFAGVTPLDRSRGRAAKGPSAAAAAERASLRAAEAARSDDAAVREHLRALVEDRARFEVSDDGSHVEGRRVDLPLAALQRLRRGETPIDGRIDLHGMGLAEARSHLELGLRTMRARGERGLLVIHGKGKHSPGGMAVLRGEIAAWLSQGPASEHVAAFATARHEDGGQGAVYVLLRR